MEKEQMMKFIKNAIPIGIGVICVVIVTAVRILGIFDNGVENTFTSSTLIEAIEIAELSTAQYSYDGIAVVYKDAEHKKINCHIRYKATVDAYIDMKKIDFVKDEDNMTVKPILPELSIKVDLVDENTLSFMPSNPDIEFKDALRVCQEDAEREATQSDALIETAEDNLKSTVEALIYPIIKPEGYTIIWE